MNYELLYKLYPQIARTIDGVAYDEEGNQVEYDIDMINAQVEADAQSKEDARQTAQAKLAKIGLTPEDLKVLLG